eukprot:5897236-Pleurochrysis_carterae.AAC.2
MKSSPWRSLNAISSGERLSEGEGFVSSYSAAVRRARQRGHGQVVPRSGQCRRCVRAGAGRNSESNGRSPGSYAGGRWAVKRLLLGRVAGAAGRRRLPLVVLEAMCPAQQPELGLRWMEAERRRGCKMGAIQATHARGRPRSR